MKKYRLKSLLENCLGFDTETWLIMPGRLVPPLVCGSVAWYVDGPRIEGSLLDKEETRELFRVALQNDEQVITGANVAYDLAVMAYDLAGQGVDVMPELFKALDEDRIYDLQIAEALNAVSDGFLGKDPKTGGQLRDPITKKPGRYSLAICTDQVLGRTDAKQNDEWRLRYRELDGIALADWPENARQYPIDDAKNTLEVTLAQAGHLARVSPHHSWGPDGSCVDCQAREHGTQCLVKRPHRNLHEVSNQVWTALALHLGAAWGFRVNQQSVDKIAEYAQRNKDDGIKPFVELGVVRKDGTEDRSRLKRMVAQAYGAVDVCPVCEGTGKVPSPSNPKSKIICFKPDAVGNKLKTCDGTGLVLVDDVPRSEKDGISYGRDTLHESGNEILMDYGNFLEDRKDLDYVEYLREARVCRACGHIGNDKDPHTCGQDTFTWRDVPLTLQPNVVLETGRVSYSRYIQLFKRAPGFTDKLSGDYIPSLRECIESRPGYTFSSEDYEAGELITHAQSCKWITGDSKLMWALLNKFKPHNALAATMIGLGYEEFQKLLATGDTNCKDARQAAKPPNFGYPGGMGPVKLVHQQRKQGPNTPHPNGPNWVENDDGILVRGYKGLRFCILMDGADKCGGDDNMVREWNDRKISPTCRQCIECAVRLKKVWLRQWPENEDYFKFINDCVEEGQMITWEMLERWPHLAEVYFAGQRLAPGEILQHHSGRIRGGVEYCAAANGFFQGLLADACKSALRRISRECYDRTVKVPDMAHENSRLSRFARSGSPLLGSRPILFAHDEILCEHPDSVAHEGALRVSEIMVEELSWYCPDLAPACHAEPTLMKRWLKSAKPWYLKGGAKPAGLDDRMIPWEPHYK
jgi:DNA polymerase-1